uniref:hypothetical protein n=1 Tax=uncultured Erythrobacter sp. TaxID=263913 RepID=UPI00262AA262|nr:hypothetical protein [uncultured Erythrobacter sp.]
MTRTAQALIWAAIIIAAALIAASYGLSNGASIGIVTGLSGAAWGSLQADSPCIRECLQ